MAVNEKITCDVCGIQKGEANHWMLFKPDYSMPGLDGDIGGIRLAPWHPELYREYSHLCGEACAGRLLARSIAEWREVADLVRSVTTVPQTFEPVVHVNRIHATR